MSESEGRSGSQEPCAACQLLSTTDGPGCRSCRGTGLRHVKCVLVGRRYWYVGEVQHQSIVSRHLYLFPRASERVQDALDVARDAVAEGREGDAAVVLGAILYEDQCVELLRELREGYAHDVLYRDDATGRAAAT